MKIINANRPIKNTLLHEELLAAGFQVQTVYGDGRIQLADSETKDPSSIIAAHDPTKPNMGERTKAARDSANEAFEAKRKVIIANLKAIKDKGKANWTNDDIKEALANFLDFVGIV